MVSSEQPQYPARGKTRRTGVRLNLIIPKSLVAVNSRFFEEQQSCTHTEPTIRCDSGVRYIVPCVAAASAILFLESGEG